MLQLLKDKEAIRFTDGKRINLRLLKNQIDRRMLKITALANGMQASSRPRTERPRCDMACQFETNNFRQSIQRSNFSNKVLGDLNGNDLDALTKKEGKTKYKEKDPIESYLILTESKFNQTIQPLSQMTKQQVKTLTFYDQDPVKLTNSEQSCDNSQLNLDLSNIKFDENIGYQQQANEIKNYIRSTLSNRKKPFTDRSRAQAFQPSKTQKVLPKKHHETHELKFKETHRIVVSYECLQKMQTELNKISSQKRQYQIDYKARTNLLKKVEQKFRNDII